MNNLTKKISPKQNKLQHLLQDLPLTVSWWQEIGSTSTAAKKFLQTHLYEQPLLFGSDRQTNGYGKKDRKFISETGGIYLSLLIKIPELTSQNQGLLTTGIAWELHETIKEELHTETEIKWVNDLLLNGKKVAGILVEKPQPQIAIIGIGCNLYQQQLEEALPTGTNLLTQPLTDEQTCHFIAALIHRLFPLTTTFATGTFLPEYKKHLCLLNQEVTMQIGKTTIVGQAVDLTPQANLVIKTNKGLKTIGAGEVTKIRPSKKASKN
ncbi:biotin--[acetyl-CoA-carboxylase] ligase [Lactobacillus sp. ESL0791]|uniref:biotin--[acetyl-CoA-carboxylase] ligase n=1 Tax=Lactobacillus sp. ESL0791 TaxID=2983234 RepID=UPI0023F65543|nr:biotin--[acetyl-CoA-carboxylase] ligase [Lactobacillus sp. ESL0791]MDF7639541.1 biotin--[acetyl-CoA-carboxylase] ligase [Lactobacillus sp. ESL0791]